MGRSRAHLLEMSNLRCLLNFQGGSSTPPLEFREDWAGDIKFGSHQHINGITVWVLWGADSETDFSVYDVLQRMPLGSTSREELWRKQMGRWSWAKNQPSQPQLIPQGAMEPMKWPVRVVLCVAEVARPLHSCLNQLLDIDYCQRDMDGMVALCSWGNPRKDWQLRLSTGSALSTWVVHPFPPLVVFKTVKLDELINHWMM